MLYNDPVTIEIKTILFGKPGIKTLDTTAKFTALGDIVQFDLNLQNRDLLHRKFVIDSGCIIQHESGAFMCTEHSFTKGRPHHVVVFAKPLS